MRYLILFAFFVIACKPHNSEVVINWKDDKAISISVPDSVTVYADFLGYPMLGDLSADGDGYIFTPVVPFQAQITYFAVSKTDIRQFTVSFDPNVSLPTLITTHPSCETIPSNLLKVYFQFSEPMQEYRSSEFIRLIDNETNDTIDNAFLDLKPELWNEDETVLTLWLDPGRIKQDLIPNKKLGTVLEDEHSYRIEVAAGWKSKKGVASIKPYTVEFVTSTRDVSKPDVSQWKVTVMPDEVYVNTGETMDWMLFNNRISIRSGDQIIEAKTFSEACDRQLIIVPNKRLEPGNYSIIIDAAIEDLAGNNLNRLFETDVTDQSKNSINKEVYSLTFRVN